MHQTDNNSLKEPTSSFSSPSAARKATSRAKKKMPASPDKYAKVVQGLVKHASPRKKLALKKIGVQSTPAFKPIPLSEELKAKVKKHAKTRKGRTLRRTYAKIMLGNYKSIHAASTDLGVRWHYLNRVTKLKCELEEKPRKGLPEETVKKVQDFYQSPSFTVSLGGMKNVNRKGETVRYLTERIQTVYSKFVSDNKGMPISRSKFAKLRPKNVKLKSQIPMNQCVCNLCANIELLRSSLQKAGIQDSKLTDKELLCASTLCPSEDHIYGKIDCVERDCERCGKLDLHAEPELRKKKMSFYRWQNVATGDSSAKKKEDQAKGKKKTQKSEMTMVTVECTVKDAIAILEDDLKYYAKS